MRNNTAIVSVTGGSGSIGYAFLFRLASGAVFGPHQAIELRLLTRNTPESQQAAKGVVMELMDSAFPLLKKVTVSSDMDVVFENTDYAFLIGAQPRKAGMARADLLLANAELFKTQAESLNRVAHERTRVIVVGNPCNTNALITIENAPRLRPFNVHAMMRLDHNRAIAQLATHLKQPVAAFKHIAIWGNHSASMVPDVTHGLVNLMPLFDELDDDWIANTFTPTVAKRGEAIIAARGASSAASAASATIDHARDWELGSTDWVTMGIVSEGQYGVPAGLVCGFPCRCENGRVDIISNLTMHESIEARLQKSVAELIAERDAVRAFLP